MHEVRISGSVRDKIADLESYLIDDLKLSEEVFEEGVIVRDMSHTSILTE